MVRVVNARIKIVHLSRAVRYLSLEVTKRLTYYNISSAQFRKDVVSDYRAIERASVPDSKQQWLIDILQLQSASLVVLPWECYLVHTFVQLTEFQKKRNKVSLPAGVMVPTAELYTGKRMNRCAS